MQAAVSAGVDDWCVIECSNDLFWVNCRHESVLRMVKMVHDSDSRCLEDIEQ